MHDDFDTFEDSRESSNRFADFDQIKYSLRSIGKDFNKFRHWKTFQFLKSSESKVRAMVQPHLHCD